MHHAPSPCRLSMVHFSLGSLLSLSCIEGAKQKENPKTKANVLARLPISGAQQTPNPAVQNIEPDRVLLTKCDPSFTPFGMSGFEPSHDSSCCDRFFFSVADGSKAQRAWHTQRHLRWAPHCQRPPRCPAAVPDTRPTELRLTAFGQCYTSLPDPQNR